MTLHAHPYDTLFSLPQVMNVMHVRVLFSNNYGRHSHSFKARPTQFLWDWLDMAAPVAGAGCITINGVFMAWARWTPAGLAMAEESLAKALGQPVGRYTQLLHFHEPDMSGNGGKGRPKHPSHMRWLVAQSKGRRASSGTLAKAVSASTPVDAVVVPSPLITAVETAATSSVPASPEASAQAAPAATALTLREVQPAAE